jgi:hypothetical protein
MAKKKSRSAFVMIRMIPEDRADIEEKAERFGMTVTGLSHMAIKYYLHEIERTGALLTAESKRGKEI